MVFFLVDELKISCVLGREEHEHHDDRLVVCEELTRVTKGKKQKSFCVACASKRIFSKEPKSIKVMLIGELERIVQKLPRDAFCAVAQLFDSKMLEVVVEAGARNVCFDETLEVARKLCAHDISRATYLATSFSLPSAVRKRGARLVVALCGNRQSSAAQSDDALRILFDSILDRDMTNLRREAVSALENLVAPLDEPRISPRRLLTFFLATFEGPESNFAWLPLLQSNDETPVNSAVVVSLTRIIAAFVENSRYFKDQAAMNLFRKLVDDESFLRSLKAGFASLVRDLSLATTDLVAELSLIDHKSVSRPPLIACGNGILVAYLWDELDIEIQSQPSSSSVPGSPDDLRLQSRDASSLHRKNIPFHRSPYLRALEAMAKSSPRDFYSSSQGMGGQHARSLLTVLDPEHDGPSLSATEACIENRICALNLMAGMIGHHHADETPPSSIDFVSSLRILSSRIVDPPTLIIPPHEQKPTERASCALMPSLRAAEWRVLEALFTAVSTNATTVFDAEIVATTIQAAVLGALKDAKQGFHNELSRNLLSPRSTRDTEPHHDEFAQSKCVSCAVISCLTTMIDALRTSNPLCQDTKVPQQQRRLAACLTSIHSAYFDTGAASTHDLNQQTCQLCSTLYVQQLHRALRQDNDKLKIRDALCQGGFPLSLLRQVSYDTTLGLSVQRDKMHFAFLQCFLLLCGFDLDFFLAQDEKLRDDFSKDWLFAFRWFAREARMILTSMGPSHEKSILALSRISAEILCELPHERIPATWPVGCQKCVAIFLLHACALESVSSYTAEAKYSKVALESLLRPSTFSTLFNEGMLRSLSGSVGLLNLIGATYHHNRTQLEIPHDLVEQILQHFQNTSPGVVLSSARILPQQVMTMLVVLITFPSTLETSKALCICIERASRKSLSALFRLNTTLPLQLLQSQCHEESPDDFGWNERFSRAFKFCCLTLGDAIVMEQEKRRRDREVNDEGVVEMLTPRVRALLRPRLHTQLQNSQQYLDDKSSSMSEASQDSVVARALTMTMLRASSLRAVNTNIVRSSISVLENVCDRWKDDEVVIGKSALMGPQTRTPPEFEVLFWCLKATNVSLGRAIFQHSRDAENVEAKSLAIRALRQRINLILSMSKAYMGTFDRIDYDVTYLIHMCLVVEATKSTPPTPNNTEFSSDTLSASRFYPGGTLDGTTADAFFAIPLQSLEKEVPKYTSASKLQSAKVSLACWCIASLLESPASVVLLRGAQSTNVPNARKLWELISLRLQEVITSPLGCTNNLACEGACAALARLVAIESRTNFQCCVSMTAWYGFSCSWLLSQQSTCISPHAALFVRTQIRRLVSSFMTARRLPLYSNTMMTSTRKYDIIVFVRGSAKSFGSPSKKSFLHKACKTRSSMLNQRLEPSRFSSSSM